ncbi:hypothetical protein GCM10028787_31040 [Brachybacterium horti]
MTEVTVMATRQGLGWDLEIPGHPSPAVQVATLDRAARRVREFLDAVEPGVTHDDWEVTILPPDVELGAEVRASRETTRAASQMQEAAAREARALVARLDAADYRGADIAGLLGISRTRASQLLKEAGIGGGTR